MYDLCFARKENDKTYWDKCGVLLEKDDGQMSVKLNLIPVNFNGWLNAFERKEKEVENVPF
jgi:hypothetical protein